MRAIDAHGHQLEDAAADSYAALVAAARADGISAPSLSVVSAYRTSTEQQKLWEEAIKKYGSEEKARIWVAPPGHSAHETGRALDFNIGNISFEDKEEMRAHPAYKWLEANASKYGWKPYGAEPWHWSYSGSLIQAAEQLPLWAKVTTALFGIYIADAILGEIL